MFPALGAVLGLLHPVVEGVLRRGLKFQTCTDTLNKFFLTILGFFGSPHVYVCIISSTHCASNIPYRFLVTYKGERWKNEVKKINEEYAVKISKLLES